MKKEFRRQLLNKETESENQSPIPSVETALAERASIGCAPGEFGGEQTEEKRMAIFKNSKKYVWLPINRAVAIYSKRKVNVLPLQDFDRDHDISKIKWTSYEDVPNHIMEKINELIEAEQ